jgi:hypothetical protein
MKINIVRGMTYITLFPDKGLNRSKLIKPAKTPAKNGLKSRRLYGNIL